MIGKKYGVKGAKAFTLLLMMHVPLTTLDLSGKAMILRMIVNGRKDEY